MQKSRTLLVAAVAVLALVLAFLAGSSFGSRGGDTPQPSPGAQASGLSVTAKQIAPEEGRTGNVTVTNSSVIIGDEDAPTQATVYLDTLCPFCQALELGTDSEVKNWVESGDLAVEYVMVNYLDIRSTNHYTVRTNNLLAWVADNAPQKWFDVMISIYEMQPAARGEEGPSDEDLIAVVEDHGIEVSEEDKSLITGLAYHDWTYNATASAARAGVAGIPTVVLNDKMVEEAGEPEGFVKVVGEEIKNN